jgi:hypothetical protein
MRHRIFQPIEYLKSTIIAEGLQYCQMDHIVSLPIDDMFVNSEPWSNRDLLEI